MDWNRLERITAPTAPLFTVEQFKLWVRQDIAEEDALIETLIADATDYVEGPHGIGVALREQQWRYALDFFPRCIGIPLGPVMTVDAVKYTDKEGAEQTADPATYRVDTISSPARIALAVGAFWPTTIDELNAVRVEFTAGYTDAPGDLKRAVALLAAHWYANREPVVTGESVNEIPFTVENILSKYRVGRFA